MDVKIIEVNQLKRGKEEIKTLVTPNRQTSIKWFTFYCLKPLQE